MEGVEITHRTVSVNGIAMHVAEHGAGPAVLLLHGFPELWYSWRRHMAALAGSGYRAVAPDLRGFGDTEAPSGVSEYTMLHAVGDLVALIDTLGEDKVFIVGHDWGAIVAWHLCMFRPDKVRALVALSVPFRPRHPSLKPLQMLRAAYGDDYYICAFQDMDRAEAEFARIDTALLMKKFLTYHEPKPVLVPRDKGFGLPPEADIALPPWLSDEDVAYFACKYSKTGFTGGLNYYRALDLNWELTAAWTGARVEVPVKFVVGDEDLTYHIPGVKEYVHGGGLKKDVPQLQEVVVMEGAGHFVTLEQPLETTDHIITFIHKY